MNEGIGEITGLKATQRDADRVGVYVDGKYLLALNMADVARLGLCVGMKWEGGIAEEAEVAKGYGKAYKQAVNRLGRRMMSEGMMRDKLRALKHEDVVIDAVIDKLLELGLLDDLKFGRALVHHSHLGKPTGPAMVKSRLWGKGLKAGLIDQLIGEMKEEEGYDQLEMAKRLIRSRLRGLARHDEVTRKRRLYGVLSRRGFDMDIVSKAMGMLGELEREAEEDGLI